MTNEQQIHIVCINRSGLNDFARKMIPSIYGPGKWIPAILDECPGEIYKANDGLCVFCTKDYTARSLDHTKLVL